MKRQSIVRAATMMAATAAVVTGLFAAFSGSADAATLSGIRNTKHNLSSSSTGTNKTDTGEVCVFCHTPHGSSTTAAAPLWNKAVKDPRSYDAAMYSSQTFDGAADVGFISSSVSLACLSCHDGSQAMDTVMNSPGSGGYNANGARMTVNGTAVTWTGGPADGKMTGIANLMGDGNLKNDHPVGMQYAKWGTKTLDADFTAATQVSGKDIWYVESGAVAGRDKTDMALYTRTVTIAGATQPATPYVECASCHDQHVENATFLRIDNTESKVCLTCHTK